MWKVPRLPRDTVGTAFSGGSSAASLDETMQMLSPEHSPNGPHPLFVRDHGLTAYIFHAVGHEVARGSARCTSRI
eukprot:3555909-Pyramimonas_sp.AAC.2